MDSIAVEKGTLFSRTTASKILFEFLKEPFVFLDYVKDFEEEIDYQEPYRRISYSATRELKILKIDPEEQKSMTRRDVQEIVTEMGYDGIFYNSQYVIFDGLSIRKIDGSEYYSQYVEAFDGIITGTRLIDERFEKLGEYNEQLNFNLFDRSLYDIDRMRNIDIELLYSPVKEYVTERLL